MTEFNQDIIHRAFEPKDYRKTYKLRMQDADVYKTADINISDSLESEMQWVNNVIFLHENDEEIWLIIEEEFKKKSFGIISLLNIDYVNRSAELEVVLEKKYSDKGYFTDSVSLLLKHGFNEIGLNRISAKISEKSIKLSKTFEALGFFHEGVLINALKSKKNYQNIHVYSILRAEFAANLIKINE